MRAMFKSQMNFNPELAIENLAMISNGKRFYSSFPRIIAFLSEIQEKTYIPLPKLYEALGIKPFVPQSKRLLYSNYKSGIVVGAGSSEDCKDLIGKEKWTLIDLTDKRMKNFAVGYENKNGNFMKLSESEGNTLEEVDKKYIQEKEKIQVQTLDSLDMISIKDGIISIDVEGLALDVLTGSKSIIKVFKPDLLVSIYHNWIEYLLIIPLLYDYGYTINCIMCTNPLAHQPHLELCLCCSYE